MRLRKAGAALLPLLCIFLFSCGIRDYPTYTYELKNGLGEEYLVNYCEQTNYPENNTRVKVFKGKEKIIDYNGGSYTGCDSYTPSQIMLICSSDNVDYYYIRSQLAEYIIADGVIDMKVSYNMLKLGKSKAEMSDEEKKTYLKLAGTMRSAISAENAAARFADCGYDASSFLLLYNYS